MTATPEPAPQAPDGAPTGPASAPTAPASSPTAPAMQPPASGPASDVEHSCEHCSGHGETATPGDRAADHVALARRRLVPRLVLGVLGLLASLVLALRYDQALGTTSLVFVAAGVAWLVAAWGGVLLGALLTRRGARVQLALGQVIAAALAPVTALAIALPLVRDAGRAVLDGASLLTLMPALVAAASGWFLAAAIGELVRVLAVGREVHEQDDRGLLARAEAERLTLPAIQRAEVLALGLALGYGAIVAALAVLPWLVLVLVPLTAAGAAYLGLRPAAAEAAASARG